LLKARKPSTSFEFNNLKNNQMRHKNEGCSTQKEDYEIHEKNEKQSNAWPVYYK
jgi:hypothetical protein